MKKYLLLLLLLVVISLITQAQDSTWIKDYIFDAPQYHYDLIETYDKGYIITGNQLQSFEYPAPDFAFILKTDINGDTLWKKLVGYLNTGLNTNVTGGKRIKQTSDGGYILVGETGGAAGLTWDVYALKLDACGEKEWSRIFRNDNDDQPVGDVCETEDGSFLVSLTGWEDWNHTGKEWVIKLSPDGETVWMKSYGDWEGSNHWYYANTETYQMLPTNAGNFVTVGETYKVQLPDTNTFYKRPMFVEIDTAGNEIWHNVYTDNLYVGAAYIGDIDSHDNLYAGGFTAYSTVLNYPGDQPVLYKLDSAGNMLWFKVLVDTNAIHGSSVPVSLMDDTILFSGTTYWHATNGEDSVYEYLVKLDTGGREIKKRLIAHVSDFEHEYSSRCSLITFDDKYLVSFQYHSPTFFQLRKYNKNLEYDSIYTATYTYDSLCPHPIQSDTINLDTTVVNLSEVMLKFGVMSLYPNPASSKVRIEINVVKRIPRVLTVVSPAGKTVYNTVIAPGRANAVVDVSSWPAGFYLFTLFEQGIPVQTGKLAVVR